MYDEMTLTERFFAWMNEKLWRATAVVSVVALAVSWGVSQYEGEYMWFPLLLCGVFLAVFMWRSVVAFDREMYSRWWESADTFAEMLFDHDEGLMPEVYVVGNFVAITNVDGDDGPFHSVMVEDRRRWIPYSLHHEIYMSDDGRERQVQTIKSLFFRETCIQDETGLTTMNAAGVHVETWDSMFGEDD